MNEANVGLLKEASPQVLGMLDVWMDWYTYTEGGILCSSRSQLDSEAIEWFEWTNAYVTYV